MAAAEKKNTYTAAEVAELQTTIRQQQAEIEDLNKNPPAQPGVLHRRVQPFDTSLHVTSCEYDLPAAKVLLLATR